VGARLLIERVALLEDIARDAGTPVYIYDAGHVRTQYRALIRALSAVPHRVFYSVKANGNLGVLSVLHELGAGADVVSIGEFVRARRVGFRAADVIFSGVGKRLDELRRTVRDGIGLINVESAEELGHLADIAAALKLPVRIGIRVNPDVKTKAHPYTQTGEADKKFGVPLPQVLDLVRRALAIPFLRLESIGMHLGSQICDPQAYVTAGSRIVDLVAKVRSLGVETLRAVDVGGGLGICYTDESALEPEAFAAAVTPLARETGLTLFVEPGRYLVGNAGVLLARCLYRKKALGKAFVVLDAAMNDLLRPSLYGAEHHIQVVGADRASPAEGRERVDIVGPVCETGDFLGRDRYLPAAQPGALLAISGVGAYGFSMSSTYNSRPRAAEVVIDGERWAVARRRESLEDLMVGERTLDEIEAADAWRDTAAAEFETP